MYQALYRKYRPKTFEDVVDQDIIIQTLQNSIVNNKINHAYILTGPRGCGKTTIAKIFAQLVNCENSDGKNLCNKCAFCTQIKEQTMDIIEMDAASNNGVDEIREINNKVNLVPTVGKYKIYIIDEVHMLTIGAFNALLKTLEEPPSHAIFILATTDPQKVPITILSRCQRFDLKKISDEKIIERLIYICNEEKIEYDLDAISEIARLGDGCLRDSISILDQVYSYKSSKITVEDVHLVNGTLSQKNISEIMECIVENDLNKIINLISKYTNEGKSAIKITEEIINFLKNSIMMKSKINNIEDIYVKFVNNFEIENLIEFINIMNDTLYDMKKFSDPKLILELSFIKIISKLNNNINVNNTQKSCNILENNINTIDSEDLEKKSKVEKKPILENKIIEKQDKKISKSSIQNDAKLKNNLIEFINTRVDNTLSNFNKKLTLDLKESIQNLMNYIFDSEYGSYVSTIMDGTLKAASDEYMILTYKSEHLANEFNENIEQIEKTILNILDKKYKVIALSEEKWKVIKDEFNNKKRDFIYKDEKYNIKDLINNLSSDDMKDLFGELVEYK